MGFPLTQYDPNRAWANEEEDAIRKAAMAGRASAAYRDTAYPGMYATLQNALTGLGGMSGMSGLSGGSYLPTSGGFGPSGGGGPLPYVQAPTTPSYVSAPSAPAPIDTNWFSSHPSQYAIPDTVSLNTADFSKANDAAFARAKDQVGQSTQGSLTAMRAALAARGLLGSGQEAGQTGSLVQGGANRLADVSREQAIQGSQRESEALRARYEGDIAQRGQTIGAEQGQASLSLQQQIALLNTLTAQRSQDMSYANSQYEGGIAQRGQDISANNAIYSGDLTQRSQDLTAYESEQDRLLRQAEFGQQAQQANLSTYLQYLNALRGLL